MTRSYKALSVAINKAFDRNDLEGRLFLVRLRDALRHHHEPSYDHCMRVGRLARDFALFAGATERAAENLGLVASCHDVGKLLVPPDLLDKPRPDPSVRLSQEERDMISRHSREGSSLLEGVDTPLVRLAMECVCMHHKSFRRQKKMLGKVVPIGLQVICLCDTFDSSVSVRPYRKTLSPADALEQMLWRATPKAKEIERSAIPSIAVSGRKPLLHFFEFQMWQYQDKFSDKNKAQLYMRLQELLSVWERQPKGARLPTWVPTLIRK